MRLQMIRVLTVAAVLCLCAASAQAPESPPQAKGSPPAVTLRLAPGLAYGIAVPGAVKGKFTTIVGDPKIADLTYGPKNRFLIVGLKEGVTNFLVFDDETGEEIYSAVLKVGGDKGVRMEVHNKALVSSFTTYRCAPICVYTGEVSVQEPAPLPRGNTQRTDMLDVRQVIQGNVPVAVPVAPTGP